ncbi:MAG: AzlC family ABC transporter permease [Bdellovibrionales bacterium]
MLPIITGIIPFGAVMGTVCANAQFSLFETVSMNILVFAGAAQLASVDLMTKHAAIVVIIATGLIINLRFLLYSAALSPTLQRSSLLTKLTCSYFLTDQSYAVMTAHQDKLQNNKETISFYLGTCVCMAIAWHLSVIVGYVFGNFAPTTWALDYAVPLSFMALVVPTLKNKIHLLVALFSSVVSLMLHDMPYKTGLIFTALLAIAVGVLLTRKKKVAA